MGGNRKELLPANSSRACSGFRFRVRRVRFRVWGLRFVSARNRISYLLTIH